MVGDLLDVAGSILVTKENKALSSKRASIQSEAAKGNGVDDQVLKDKLKKLELKMDTLQTENDNLKSEMVSELFINKIFI
jgi:hypothetical protein